MLVAVLVMTCGSSFGMINPASLSLNWTQIVHRFEIWRLFSAFFFYGTFGLPFLINLYLLVQYSSRYEESPYNTGAGGTSADYAWMLMIGGAILCALGYCFQLVFMGEAFSFMILYVWTRKNPDEQTSLFGFKVQAFYLPFALIAFRLLIGNPIFLDILGIGAGHLYYFLHYVFPSSYGQTVVKTPAFLREAFGGAVAQPPIGRAGAPAPRPQAGHNWGGGRVLGAD